MSDDITKIAISSIHALSYSEKQKHPVFLVTTDTNISFVLKVEGLASRWENKDNKTVAVQAQCLTLISALYGRITQRHSKVRVLNDNEIEVLKRIAVTKFSSPAISKNQTDDATGEKTAVHAYFRESIGATTRGGQPTSMTLVLTYEANLNELQELKSTTAELQCFVDFIQSGAESVYPLGRLAAVDIFTGNNDRFTTNGELMDGGKNIFFVSKSSTASGKREVSLLGLDNWDTFSMYSDLTKTFSANEALADSYKERLQVLTNPSKRKAFATTFVKSLNDALHGKLGRNDLKPISDSDLPSYVDQMDEGIRLGFDTLSIMLKKEGTFKKEYIIVDKSVKTALKHSARMDKKATKKWRKAVEEGWDTRVALARSLK